MKYSELEFLKYILCFHQLRSEENGQNAERQNLVRGGINIKQQLASVDVGLNMKSSEVEYSFMHRTQIKIQPRFCIL